MKQLIALGNGCLCPAAQGNILEACPTDPGLCKHIQAITQNSLATQPSQLPH